MDLRWKNNKTQEIGVAFVTDYDANMLTAMGYYHAWIEDVEDDQLDGALVEIWKPYKEKSNMKHDFKLVGNEWCCRICGNRVSIKTDYGWIFKSNSEGDEYKGICHSCLVEHCCNTNCLVCDWYKYPNCPHTRTKKIYMEE